jgi:hypothetical protein
MISADPGINFGAREQQSIGSNNHCFTNLEFEKIWGASRISMEMIFNQCLSVKNTALDRV